MPFPSSFSLHGLTTGTPNRPTPCLCSYHAPAPTNANANANANANGAVA
ncbi:hypothetical protein [Acetobacter persici]|nr:hypothetical protein [Acetobacter persici]